MGYCNIEVGQNIIGYWGARHPYTYGVVKAIEGNHASGKLIVEFDDGDGETFENHSKLIDVHYGEPQSSGIGIYVES
jgi:hypothetical protein